jgi:hypothetical protein
MSQNSSAYLSVTLLLTYKNLFSLFSYAAMSFRSLQVTQPFKMTSISHDN